MPLAAGDRLGPYEVLGPLGAGGMGEVFRARDTRLGRTVALKLLPVEFAADPERRRRFQREAQAVAALSHPHICTLFDVGQEEGRDFLVMEYLEGPTLAERLDEGPLPIEQALRYAMQMAEALDRAHREGIVHRDLKPSNVVLTRAGVKLVDFGLARLADSAAPGDQHTRTQRERPLTEQGQAMGTLPYMAPEQIEGEAADARTDIFALGVVLYEMATGRRAFSGKSRSSLIAAILQGDPPPLAAVQPLAPPGLEKLVKGCLAKDPADRWQTAREVSVGLGLLTDAQPSRRGRGRPFLSRGRWPAVALGLLVLAAAAGGGWAMGHYARRPPAFAFHRLTFQRGNILNARFAPDGQTVVYAASWGGRPVEVFLARTDGTGARSLDLPSADILALSPAGEMAILLKRESVRSPRSAGVLARVPLTGGAPREVLEDVTRADWDPGGRELAVVHSVGARNRIEYPLGQVLYETPYWIRSLRFSPRGDLLAFIECPRQFVCDLKVVDRQGRVRVLASNWIYLSRVAWRNDEILFAGGLTPAESAIYAAAPSGGPRPLVPNAGAELYVHDVSRDGHLLVERSIERRGIFWGNVGGRDETEVSWLDGSLLEGLSSDGRTVLFTETADGGGPTGGVFVRRTDGSPATRLGDGNALALSPDGRWALAESREASPRLWLLPTGPGEPRAIELGQVVPLEKAVFLGDGARIVFTGFARGRAPRVWVVATGGGEPRPVTPEGVMQGLAASPDGTRVAVNGALGAERGIFSVDGGRREEVPGLEEGELPIQWSADGHHLYLVRAGRVPAPVLRLDLTTGKKEVWRQIAPPIGYLANILAVAVTRDGAFYAYTYGSALSSDLFVVDLH